VTDSLKDIKDATNRLVTTTKPREPLPAPLPRPAIAAGVGFAEPQTPPATPGTGGIASPLTETNFTDRTYHPETLVASSDGVFQFVTKRTKSLKFTDASNRTVRIDLKAP
jgi:hypothetical protein